MSFILLRVSNRVTIIKRMSTFELKSQISQWIETLPPDKLEQVLAFVSFLSGWPSDAVEQSSVHADAQRFNLHKHCGAIRSNQVNGADNDSIDRDLAQSYAS